jgi:hypothetical protein
MSEETFLPNDRMAELRRRWAEIQTEFVDDPRTSVRHAHGMVAEVVNELTETFTRERNDLESQWNRQEQPDTEALRVALQRYRAFFNRLLGSSEPGQDVRREGTYATATGG